MWILPSGCGAEHSFVKNASFRGSHQIEVIFAGPVESNWAKNPENYVIFEKQDPDIPLNIDSVRLSADQTVVSLLFEERLDQSRPHVLRVLDILAEGESRGTVVMTVKKLYIGQLFSILIGAMLVTNYVFTKYLGLCVFFGCSQKRSTAIGMGITFTPVIICSAMMAWLLNEFVLKPLRLDFLQIVVFIGLVSLFVQAVDTILRKVNPALFKAFGVYLVLVIANCIIIAVPLTLADNAYDAWESLLLAGGAGGGFLIALFLMSCVRERLDLADIPQSYRGLPIAFILAGLFALSFMGFSGMSIF
jgi:electron transport complex protein RnfA